ncbi:hypothetical protein KCP71_13240 [Salmonella enterica subsp. enterica]|nr:hypothetical protein KCP71_13240 [Salmonella enterica subsp. enterica]
MIYETARFGYGFCKNRFPLFLPHTIPPRRLIKSMIMVIADAGSAMPLAKSVTPGTARR